MQAHWVMVAGIVGKSRAPNSKTSKSTVFVFKTDHALTLETGAPWPLTDLYMFIVFSICYENEETNLTDTIIVKSNYVYDFQKHNDETESVIFGPENHRLSFTFHSDPLLCLHHQHNPQRMMNRVTFSSASLSSKMRDYQVQ